MAWTYERVEILTLLWKQGKSASQIAAELGEGASRNAVIGKIHRLGLSERSGSSQGSTKHMNKGRPSKGEYRSDPSTNADSHKSVKESKASLNVKTPKKRGRKPSNKTTNIDQNSSITQNNIDESNQFGGVVDGSEVDKQAIVNMLELEKNAKKLSLMEITERTCKWPIGDPATTEFWFCGHPAESGKPYCATHVAIAFQPVSTRRDRRQR